MNPSNTGEVLKVADPVDKPVDVPAETTPLLPVEAITSEPPKPNFLSKEDDLDLLGDREVISDEVIPEEKTAAIPAQPPFVPPVVSDAPAVYNQNFSEPAEKFSTAYTANDQSATNNFQTAAPVVSNANKSDGLYHITFVEEKNASGRNLLLLGAFLLVTATVFGGITYSLFKQNPYIGSLNDNDVSVVYTTDTPRSD